MYFTRTPAVPDGAEIVLELNAACRELFGVRVAGCKGQHFRFVEERLCSNPTSGLFPPDGVAKRRLRATQTISQIAEGFA